MAKVAVTGQKQCIQALRKIEPAVYKALKVELRNGAKSMISEMKAKAPVETGLLRQSIGVSVWFKRRAKIIVAYVGPRRRFRRALTYSKRGKLKVMTEKNSKGNTGKRWRHATKYAHLVEFGTKRNRAHPFIGPTFSSKSQSVLNTILTNMAAKLKLG